MFIIKKVPHHSHHSRCVRAGVCAAGVSFSDPSGCGTEHIQSYFFPSNRISIIQKHYKHLGKPYFNNPKKHNWLVVYLPSWKIWKTSSNEIIICLFPLLMESHNPAMFQSPPTNNWAPVGRFFFIPGTIPSLPALERYAAARGVSALGPPLWQWLGDFFLGKSWEKNHKCWIGSPTRRVFKAFADFPKKQPFWEWVTGNFVS